MSERSVRIILEDIFDVLCNNRSINAKQPGNLRLRCPDGFFDNVRAKLHIPVRVFVDDNILRLLLFHDPTFPLKYPKQKAKSMGHFCFAIRGG